MTLREWQHNYLYELFFFFNHICCYAALPALEPVSDRGIDSSLHIPVPLDLAVYLNAMQLCTVVLLTEAPEKRLRLWEAYHPEKIQHCCQVNWCLVMPFQDATSGLCSLSTTLLVKEHHHHHHYPSHQLVYRAENEAPPPLSATGQPLDGAPAVVHLLHFRFHSSSSGCFRSTTLPLSLWGPVDCNFGDGVGILAKHVPNPAPSLSGGGGLHTLLVAPC